MALVKATGLSKEQVETLKRHGKNFSNWVNISHLLTISPLLVIVFIQTKCNRVYTVSLSCWCWAIIKYMSQMCSAFGAFNFFSDHSMTQI